MNATIAFLGPEADWARAVVQLDDVHGLWGGQAVTVIGTGHVTVKRIGPTFRAGHWETTLTETETHTLFRQFIEQDFAALTLPDHTPIPDETHPQITLTNARGDTYAVIKWARQRQARFERLYAALSVMAAQATRAE